MTSEIYDDEQPTQAYVPPEPLPALVHVSTAFSSRLPSQRVLDVLARVEPVGFGELAQAQPFRIVAFRALLRDYPEHDVASLWAHAYDVEVEVADAVDPTQNGNTTPAPSFADTGG